MTGTMTGTTTGTAQATPEPPAATARTAPTTASAGDLATSPVLLPSPRADSTSAAGGPVTGRGLDRVDARLKVMGKAVYAAEFAVANVAHAVIVTAGASTGHIESIDVGRASASPGVLLVMTHENAPRLPSKEKEEDQSPTDRRLQLLQDAELHYNDQPIAVVVADTLERAQHAAYLVGARYQAGPRPPLTDIEAAIGAAYAPARISSGPVDSNRGDFAAAFAAAPVKLEQTYVTPVQNHNPMEMHATVAVWQGSDRLTVYDSTQGIFGVRKKLASTLGLPVEAVRVISPYVGGGFGSKGSTWSHVVLAAMAARAVGRPVKLVVTRAQMFSLVGHRPKTIQRVALAAGRDGQLLAIRHEVVSETSRIDEFVEPAAAQTRMLYACDNVRTSHRLVRLDVPTPTFMRAPGESTGTYALEAAMDELAHTLGLDPLALRLRNHADRDPDERKPWSSKSLRQCYEQAAERFGWKRRPMAPRAQRDGRWLVGWGMATATYPAGQGTAAAVARVRADGSALVQAGSQDIGTGTYTIMSQIAADGLGLPFAQVRFELGDTRLPETPGSGGSRTAATVGSAVQAAALAARAKLAALAVADAGSPLHGLPPTELEAHAGAFTAPRARPGKRDRYADILARAGLGELEARAETKASPSRKQFSTHSFGAQFAEVRVDPELGEVRVSRLVAAFATGKILNAKTARSQFLGGMVWGIGFALHEQTVRDARNGRAVTRDLADYHVPVHADVPALEVIMIDEEDPHVSGVGAKGIGEIGITGAVAAIANAVFHATGRRVRDLPITPDKLL
jgi:xanthine dehydrogenase YagR molybdenum-binding subunit